MSEQVTEPGGAFAPLGGLLEQVDFHAAGSDLTREEAVADLVVAGIFRLYGPAGFPRTILNPGGYDRGELAGYERSKPLGSSRAWELSSPELASSAPQLVKLRAEQLRQLHEAEPDPATPCDACGDDGPGDRSWASMARATREACALLGWPIIARCLPGEPAECGHGYAGHTAAHLATLLAIAEHHLSHLEPPAGLVEAVRLNAHRELERRHRLQLPGRVLP